MYSFTRNLFLPLAFVLKYQIQSEKKKKVQFYFIFSFLNMLRSLLEWSTQKLSNNHNDNVIGVF